MDWLPYYLGFALCCFILSIGLQRRTVWMWYLGWAIFYMIAGYFGTLFFPGLYEAQNGAQIAYACIYLAGGLMLWLPAAVWWGKHRHLFGRPGAEKPRVSGNETTSQKTGV